MNIEIFVSWENSGREGRSCAALMATGRGTIKVGLNSIPRLEYPPAGFVQRKDRAPTVVWSEIDDRQTELTLEQAGWLVDALAPIGDADAAALLEPLGLEVFSGTEINQWFDDIPHVYRDFELPGYVPPDAQWWETTEELVHALKAVVSAASMLEAAQSVGETEVPDHVIVAITLLGHSVRTQPCYSNPDECDCLAAQRRVL